MNKEPEQLALDLRRMLGEARSITNQTDFNRVFVVAENIIGTLAYLISPIVLLEQKYRAKVVEFIDGGNSNASAEARGRASDEYAEWKKYNMLYDLAHEQVLLLKKFKDKLDDEFEHS